MFPEIPSNLNLCIESLCRSASWMAEAVDHEVVTREEAITALQILARSAAIAADPAQADAAAEFIHAVILALGS